MTDVNQTGQRRAALLNDLSCFGKCSLTVALPVLAAAGVEGLPLPTALLSTHTGGFTGYTCTDLTGEMEATARHWKTLSLHLDAVATGYFCSPAQVEFAGRFAAEFSSQDTLLLVDPVMADAGSLYPGFDLSFAEKMRGLCAAADLITPNLTEACLLAGQPYEVQPSPQQLELCLTRLQTLGAKNVVVTGVRRQQKGKEYIGYVCAGETGTRFEVWHPFVPTSLHGCGDVFAAALLAALLQGACGEKAQANAALSGHLAVAACGASGIKQRLNAGPHPQGGIFEAAVHKAAEFTRRCVLATKTEQYPGHWYGLRFEEELAGGFWSNREETE